MLQHSPVSLWRSHHPLGREGGDAQDVSLLSPSQSGPLLPSQPHGQPVTPPACCRWSSRWSHQAREEWLPWAVYLPRPSPLPAEVRLNTSHVRVVPNQDLVVPCPRVWICWWGRRGRRALMVIPCAINYIGGQLIQAFSWSSKKNNCSFFHCCFDFFSRL